jgi:predicted flap endonuclease-1-like 5' DNA nuclease
MNAFTHPVTAAYTGKDATLEIIVMLVGAALVGYFIHYLTCKMRGCCHGAGCENCTTPAATPVVPVAKAAVAAPVVHTHDDLEIIEGIGPKVKQLLNQHNVFSFVQVAGMTPTALKDILEKGGDRFRMLPTDTWPKQAGLARDGKTSELEEYKKYLVNGREPGTN